MSTVYLCATPLRGPLGHWVRLLGLSLIFVSLSSQAQQALTLDDALRLAQGRSLQLVAQDAAAGAARAMAVSAGQMPDPTLKLGINNLPVNGPDRLSLTRDFMTMRSVGVSQEITGRNKLTARSVRFEREAELAQAGRVAALANLRRDTAAAWLERAYQERTLAVLQTLRAEAALQIEAADAAYRGGRGSQSDVFAARSSVAQIDDRIRLIEIQVATARIKLARWVGDDANQPLAAMPDTSTLNLNAGSLDSLVAHHPAVALMAGQENVARAEADIAQSNKRSDWSVELMASQRGPAYSNMVSINLSIPIQFDQKNRQDREVAARWAVVEQMRAQREEAIRERVAEARMWLAQWQGNRDRLERYDRAQIPFATERTRAAMAAYRGGGGALPAVLEARRMEIDTRLDRLRLEMETASLWAQLAYLIPAENMAAIDRPARVLKSPAAE